MRRVDLDHAQLMAGIDVCLTYVCEVVTRGMVCHTRLGLVRKFKSSSLPRNLSKVRKAEDSVGIGYFCYRKEELSDYLTQGCNRPGYRAC